MVEQRSSVGCVRRAAWLAVALFALDACGSSKHHEPGSDSTGGEGRGTLLVLDTVHAPVSGVQVLVNGAVVTTDENGEATLPSGLPASYDLAVVSNSHVYAFVGLKTRSPSVVLANQYLSAELAHTRLVLPIPADLDLNQQILLTVAVIGEDAEHQDYGGNFGNTEIDEDVYWVGSPSATVSAEAFLVDVEPSSGAITDYVGYATQDWPNAGGLELTWSPTFGPMPVDTTNVEFAVDLPAGAIFDFDEAFVTETSGRSGKMASTQNGATAKLLVPNLPGAHYDLQGLTHDTESSFVAEAHGVAPGATAHAQALTGPKQVAPADRATDVTADTDFTWTAPEGAIHHLLAYTADAGPYLEYSITSAVPSVRIPDLGALGLPFPAGRTFAWSANTDYGQSSLDTYAAGERSTGWGYSKPRSFTSK
jgi:hypothetical protein